MLWLALLVNAALATIKIVVGVLGNSYVLIADGIESTADIFSSFVVWSGLRVSAMPPDENHPFGHGKAEPVAGIVVALLLLGAGFLIATQSVKEILRPHLAPGWFTLPVLLGIIVIKEGLYRFAFKTGTSLESTALKSDAWHHRSDALTSAAAFVGISIALIGGPGYESADDWAALAACGGKTEEAPAAEETAAEEMMAPAETPAAEEPVATDTGAATEEVDPTSNPIPPA